MDELGSLELAYGLHAHHNIFEGQEAGQHARQIRVHSHGTLAKADQHQKQLPTTGLFAPSGASRHWNQQAALTPKPIKRAPG
jgi:hypothetical protein